jgi:hypothetical protein
VLVNSATTYGLAAETDTLLRVEDGSLPDERLDATGTTVDLVESDLADDLVTMLPGIMSVLRCGGCGGARDVLAELLDLLDLTGQLVGEGLLQRLQLTRLARFSAYKKESACLGLAGGVAAEAIEGWGPQRGGGAEGARQSESRCHCDDV